MKSMGKIYLDFFNFSVPVGVNSLNVAENRINLTTLSSCCKKPTGLKRICKDCNKDIEWKSDLKAYKLGKELIPLTKEEIETINEVEKGIKIKEFIKWDRVNLNWLSKSYFLSIEPEGTGKHKKLYSLLNDYLLKENVVAICTYAIRVGSGLNSEHIGLIRHYKSGLILQELIKTSEIETTAVNVAISQEEKQAFKNIIEVKKDFNLLEMELDTKVKFENLIELKLEGKTIDVKPKKVEKESDVDLLSELKAIKIKA